MRVMDVEITTPIFVLGDNLGESEGAVNPQELLVTHPSVGIRPLVDTQIPPAILVAQMEHLTAAKRLADRHKRELGFINRAILQKAIASRSLLVAPYLVDAGSELAGMVHFYVRRDNTVTLCNIVVVQEYQHRGLGRRLFEELVRLTCSLGKTQIRLKY